MSGSFHNKVRYIVLGVCFVSIDKIFKFDMNSADSSWTQFCRVIEDLIGECEDHMCRDDYAVCENLLQRLHSAQIGCERVASCLSSSLRNIEWPNDEVALKVKQLSSHLQCVIDCVEKKLYDLDSSAFVSPWLPDALVYSIRLVGR